LNAFQFITQIALSFHLTYSLEALRKQTATETEICSKVNEPMYYDAKSNIIDGEYGVWQLKTPTNVLV
jgi:hypothetical protein